MCVCVCCVCQSIVGILVCDTTLIISIHVLCLLQAIFDTPVLKSGAILNKDAAKMLQLTPHTYRQMALDCVAASLRVQSE